ncbi:helix-turn-helix transcriptional regulator [Kocuria rosea]|uniref:helix-turn-helix transcriptional regulator n=1 Tax=Kocuria rosea TaxID=1275 RepID=UPI00203C8461|nr:helix-turn-helix domain-containing protein [Kocuria rosea]MCM3687689.1 helix-turn-helix domain-containing protein [Kocuria rosea]
MKHQIGPRPLTIPLWPDAAQALGIGRSTAYELVRLGQFPIRVLRLGRKLRVPTAELYHFLGVDPHDEA